VHRDNAYTLRWTVEAFRTCVQFYAQRITMGPAWAGIAVIGVMVFFSANRFVRLGLITFLSLMLVMLALPGRLAGAYLYVASIGLAIALAAIERPTWIVIFFAGWLPWNYWNLRIERSTELHTAEERHRWFDSASILLEESPANRTFIYSQRPSTLADFG